MLLLRITIKEESKTNEEPLKHPIAFLCKRPEVLLESKTKAKGS